MSTSTGPAPDVHADVFFLFDATSSPGNSIKKSDAIAMMPCQKVMMDLLTKEFSEVIPTSGVFPANFAKGLAEVLLEKAREVSNSIPKEDHRTFIPSRHLEEEDAARHLDFDEHSAGAILVHAILVGCLWFMPVDGREPPPGSQRAQLIHILAELASMSERGLLHDFRSMSNRLEKPFRNKAEFSTVCYAAEVLWGELFEDEELAYIRYHDVLAQLHFRGAITYSMKPETWAGGVIKLDLYSAAVRAEQRDHVRQALGVWILRSNKAYRDEIWKCAKSKGNESDILQSLIRSLHARAREQAAATKDLLQEAAAELEEFRQEKESDFREHIDSPVLLNS